MEKGGRVHAVGDGAADKGEPVKDHGGLVLVLEEDLGGDVEDDRENDEAKEENGRLGDGALGAELLDERVARRDLKDTHDGGLEVVGDRGVALGCKRGRSATVRRGFSRSCPKKKE